MRIALIALACLCAAVIMGIGPTKAVRNNSSTAPSPLSGATAQPPQDPIGTIDGATTPDLIPDEVAYSLFFNFVAGRVTRDERNSLRSYMRLHNLDVISVDALIGAGNDFQSASKTIDELAGSLTPQVLKQRKAALIKERIASLPDRLGTPGADDVRRHVREYLKTKVKIIPGPVMPSASHEMK
jgi:hypothetical protein